MYSFGISTEASAPAVLYLFIYYGHSSTLGHSSPIIQDNIK